MSFYNIRLSPSPRRSSFEKFGAYTSAGFAVQTRGTGPLARLIQPARRESPPTSLGRRAAPHGHCHQKALIGTGGTAALLKLIPGLDVRVLDTGYCGMAGSFGFETEHYDLSVQIAQLDLLPALALQPEALVVAPGTSCRHQIHDLTSRRALHPFELVAAALAKGIGTQATVRR